MKSGWLGVLAVIGLLAIALTAWSQHRRALRMTLEGWHQVCYEAPHTRMTTWIEEGLSEARIHRGLEGWQPTLAWVNEQCTALGLTHG